MEPVVSDFACLQNGYGDIISSQFRSGQEKVSKKPVIKYGPVCENKVLLSYHSIYSILADNNKSKDRDTCHSTAVLRQIPEII